VRPLTAAGLAAVAGAALGAASRSVVEAREPRAVAALFTAYGLAAACAAAFDAAGAGVAARCGKGAGVAATALGAAWAAAAAAGVPSALGGAAVVAGAATAACGAASLLRARGLAHGQATFAGAFVVAAAAGLVFVADPFVEWKGAGDGALERARVAMAASPLASIAEDVGLDWQRSTWLYDGPSPGAPGLSVIGQFYPSRPASPWTWALCAAAAGALALAAASPRSMRP
jgi:hypothetical protein